MSLVSLDSHLSAGASEKQEARSKFCICVWPVPHKWLSSTVVTLEGCVGMRGSSGLGVWTVGLEQVNEKL